MISIGPPRCFSESESEYFIVPEQVYKKFVLTVHSRKQNKQQNNILTRQQRLKIYQTHTTYYYHSIEKSMFAQTCIDASVLILCKFFFLFCKLAFDEGVVFCDMM